MTGSAVLWRTEGSERSVCVSARSEAAVLSADMTYCLSGGNDSSGGGDGLSALDSPASSPGRPCKPIGRRDSTKDSRNQCITDFFKPVLKQECRNGEADFQVSCSELPRKTVSSPKPNRRKKLLPASNRSPIKEALLKAARSEKKDYPDIGINMTMKAANQKVLVQKICIVDSSTDCPLKDSTFTKTHEINGKCPVRTRTPLVENSRERKMEHTTGSDLNKWTSISENDSLEKESHISWCKKPRGSKMLQPDSVTTSSQVLLETVGRERQMKEKMQSKQQSFGSVNKSLETSPSNQDSSHLLRKRASLASQESSSGCVSDKSIMKQSQSCPSAHLNPSNTSGISKHKEFSGKRKRISLKMDMKSSQKPTEKHNFSSSLEKDNSDYVKDQMLSNVQQDVMNPSNKDLPVSVEFLDVEENGDSAYDYITNTNKQIQTADVKESQSQKFSQEVVGFKTFGNELIASQENLLISKQSKELSSHIQSTNLLKALERKVHKRDPPFCRSDNSPLPPTSYKSLLKEKAEETRENVSTVPSQRSAVLHVPSLTDNNIRSSDACDPVPIPRSSCNLNELNKGVSNPKTDTLNSKLGSLSVCEDGTSDSDLDSSDDELMTLEEILAQSIRASAKRSEQRSDEDDMTDTMIASHNIAVSYMNHMEDLLKEKEEFRRADELEQQLQQLEWGAEINSLPEKQPDDGKLSAEQRAFLERFSIISDTIPDQHPGENIFQLIHAGKIFNQHNLDLRNSGFHPQNPIEKYLLGSGITQQLFVIIEGLLKSAYHSSPCPVPILKWMFQMMSIHPDSSVSRKILDGLMTLTVEHASADNDHPRPWIPSLFDIAAVLVNLGAPFCALFPLQNFQPSFTEDDIMSEMSETVMKQQSGDILGDSTPFFLLIDTSLCNMAKFLQLCISICPDGYTDEDIFLLLLLLFKLSLEKELKQFPLVDLECLVIKLLENIREWDTKMAELCVAISCLSNHHHNLLWLVQFVPNWITRGRQVRRHLSLVIISKLLKNHESIPSSHDQQMSLLCKNLVKMKPSNLLKRLSEPQVYYLIYVLLHLVREATNAEVIDCSHRAWLLKLCSSLEKHVKCDIREDVRLFYRTKL
ncbi:SMC5-SMC6 complex localization factor protein 2 isoform X2 [Varanus komodoensis]|uniref:SMC5-SMC6 complex localization factor 2 n=1 Tax=Varanus komodoensis TaxID=61221 RepID=A0A8D2LFC6_VARKO|nr:SMC5-SMC6 complex localization factor protein 2 isoform X2 [Varanus komodoensis]